MGIMITYGSYLRREDSIPRAAVRITFCDTAVAFLAGVVVIPPALAFGGAELAQKAGPGLMFDSLPRIFGQLPAGRLVGFAFFALVLFAALTSAISLTETCVSILCDAFGWERRKGMIVSFAAIVALGIFVNLGYNGLSEMRLFGMEILDFFDFVSNSVLMPIVACLTCITLGWLVREKVTRTRADGREETVELVGADVIAEEIKASSPFKAQKAWTIMVRFVAPVLVIVILVWNIIGVL